MAKVQTVRVYRGEDAELNFTMDPVVDITGWDIEFTLARRANAATKILEGVAAEVLSGAAGTFRVVLSAAQLDLPPGGYFFDTWRADLGSFQPLALGPFYILPNARYPEA